MAPSMEGQSAVSAGPSGGPWVSPAEPDGGSPWKPTMPIWRFWLLMTLTIGLYRLFWVVSVARELRQHQDPGIRPWQYVIGMLVGIASPFVASSLTEQIDRHGLGRGWDLGPPKWLIVTLAVVALVVEFGSSRFVQAEPWVVIAVLVGTYGVFVPLPWALIQLRLNRLKSAMSFPERPVRRYQFSVAQFAAIIVAVVVWPLTVIGSLPDALIDEIFAGTPYGDAVQPNMPTMGPSGGYQLEVRSSDWVRVENGTIAEDADLELVWRSPGTSVIVFALRGDWTMDEIVDFRRNEIQGQVHNLASNERRTLLADSGIPVSHARYTGSFRDGGGRATWWVSTVVTDTAAYEVLGSTMAGPATRREIEQIAKSLRLTPELP